MATPTWPASLPQKPLISGFSQSPQDNRVSFRPDVGPPIERRRATVRMQLYKMQFPPMTATQLATFEAWFHDDLADGSLHFLWADPVSGTSYKWKIESYSSEWGPHGKHDLLMNINRLPGAAV